MDVGAPTFSLPCACEIDIFNPHSGLHTSLGWQIPATRLFVSMLILNSQVWHVCREIIWPFYIYPDLSLSCYPSYHLDLWTLSLLQNVFAPLPGNLSTYSIISILTEGPQVRGWIGMFRTYDVGMCVCVWGGVCVCVHVALTVWRWECMWMLFCVWRHLSECSHWTGAWDDRAAIFECLHKSLSLKMACKLQRSNHGFLSSWKVS